MASQNRNAEQGIRNTILQDIDTSAVIAVALEAGRAVMEIYEKDFAVEYKADQSPLTEADRKAHAIITRGLQKIVAQQESALPILSEEGRDIPYEERRGWEYFWMVDPIDGTKEFIKKNGEFTVNIALIHRDAPVLGVVYAPALGEIYWAKEGEGAWKAPVDDRYRLVEAEKAKLPLQTNSERRTENDELVIVASKSHLNEETQAFIDHVARNTQHVTRISKGSSLKLLMVAEGTADIYPRLATTMEWDTAAADAIVRESGMGVYRYMGEEGGTPDILEYNKEDLLNPWFSVK
jgi:3'(2'), 5'-bisphosphate nucleotidase